jgi:hypothetical protein
MTLYFVNSASILRAAGVDVAGVAMMVGSRILACIISGRSEGRFVISLFTEILRICQIIRVEESLRSSLLSTFDAHPTHPRSSRSPAWNNSQK